MVVYWLVTFTVAPTSAVAFRWLQNDPAFGIWPLFAIPLIVAGIRLSWRDRRVRARIKGSKYLAVQLWGLCVVLAASVSVYDSFFSLSHRLPVPIALGRLAEREVLSQKHQQQSSLARSDAITHNGAVAAYRSVIDSIFPTNPKDSLGHSLLRLRDYGVFWWAQTTLSLLSGVVLATVAWFIILSLSLQRYLPPRAFDAPLLLELLFALWIPMRIYSDWYLHLGDVNATGSPAVIPLGIILTLAVAFTFALHGNRTVATLLLSALSAMGAGVAFLGQIDPTVLVGVLRYLAGFPPVLFALFCLAFALILVPGIAFMFLRPDPPKKRSLTTA
jgi:hypothetical protein